MLDFMLALVGWVGSSFISFVFGVLSLANVLRKDEPDLYCEWMDRREARREARK